MIKYKQSRISINNELKDLICQELVKQKFKLEKARGSLLKELFEISKIIDAKGLPDYLVCKKLPYQLGHGIFLRPDAKPIEKGQLIAPYSGEAVVKAQLSDEDSTYAFAALDNMVLDKRFQKIFDPVLPFHPRRLYWLKYDALKKGNFTRFVNHSQTPNVIAQTMIIPENQYGIEPSPLEILYIAKKRIHPGEQLLVSYEDEEKSYWGPLKIKPYPLTPNTFMLDRNLKLVEKR